MRQAETSAPARAALAGNPSDGYGGAVLAVAMAELEARARIEAGVDPAIDPPSALVAATVGRFARDYGTAASRCRVSWSTTIPRGVGLGGSSAIVIAVLRALSKLYRDRPLREDELAYCALAVEVEELGITAGLQDRVAQAYGGLTFMDFGSPPRYEPLDASLLPPLVIAWRASTAEDSGIVHGDLRGRHDRGEPAVVEAMVNLRGMALEARRALLAGEHEKFVRCVDGSLEARGAIMTLDPRHLEMVRAARALDAGVNYTGSGGAIVAVCRDEEHRTRVLAALRGAGCGVLALNPATGRGT